MNVRYAVVVVVVIVYLAIGLFVASRRTANMPSSTRDDRQQRFEAFFFNILFWWDKGAKAQTGKNE